ncbi:MAG: cupin domain-containing protein [Proteobacteria bacterium]|nr:cupin domain-containing protein [Pseudomonadota bacterium]MBS0270554.1 cupin domain-containing protein [Pseudomonadota bacterium]
MEPVKIAKEKLEGVDEPRGRWITKPTEGGWNDPILMEWELRNETFIDEHPHTEYAYVLEGKLFVEVDNVIVEAEAGDTVVVPAGAIGRYFAPAYARILGVYGANPKGKESKVLHFGKCD